MAKRPSDASVRDKTGKEWARWFALLDKAKAQKLSHKEIATWLREKHEVSSWWAQSITVAYEQERGLRAANQKGNGSYQVSASKTFGVPVETLYDAWMSKTKRKKWLDDPDFAVRTTTKDKTIRIDWVDSTSRVQVYFTSKGPDKSSVSVQHEKLSRSSDVAKQKSYWKTNLANLHGYLQ